MKKVRHIIALLLVLAITLMAMACDSAVAELPTSDKSEPVVWSMRQDYTTLNYLTSNRQVDLDDGAAHFLQPLIMHDNFSTLVPAAAESWEVSDDGMVWTVKLRDDILWVRQDGSDYGYVKAQDYVTSAEYVLNADNMSLYPDLIMNFVAGAYEYYEDTSFGFENVGVKAIDDLTIEYTMIEPTPWFPSLLTFSVYLPLSQEWIDEIGIENFAMAPDKLLYCGDYILYSWEKDVERTLVKNEKGIFADRIHVPYIKFFSVPDDMVNLELYKRGEISSTAVGTIYLEDVMNDPAYSDYLYVSRLGSATWWYAFNLRSPNTDCVTAAKNKNFRAAFYYAYNKQPLLKLSNPYTQEFNAGSYVPAEIAVSPEGKDYVAYGDLPMYRERNLNPYDPELSVEYMKKAVEELGDTVTWPITIRILGTISPASERANALFKQVFEDVLGEWITIETKVYPSNMFYQTMEEGDWDYAESGWSADYADPATYLNEIRAKGEGYYDEMYGFSDYPEMIEFTEMYDEAIKITADIDARYEAIAACEAFLYENFLITPDAHDGGTYALNNCINPYEAARALYGLSQSKMIDRIYGKSPITSAERAALKAEWEAERAARSN